MIIENVEYARKLSEIGDGLLMSSNFFPDEGRLKLCKNVQELISLRENASRGLDLNRVTFKYLTAIKPPNVIADEHKELLVAFNEYIASIEILLKSYDTSRGIYDSERYHLGIASLAVNEKRIEQVIEKIAEKILK